MTKVYCTLGPACSSLACLEAMVLQGMSGVRLNLSHTTLEQEEELISTVQPLEIREGTYVELDALELPDVVRAELHPGRELLLDDGKILLSIEDESLAFARRGGTLTIRKGISVPHATIQAPCLTEADRANIAQAASFGVTTVLQPFVRSRADLEEVRATLDAAGGQNIRLLAKVESLEGIESLPDLLPAADGFVIARGDLGNAMPLWDLPAAQKCIAATCNKAGKPFMVATQMLSSMEKASVPTRAELSDVFNAVLDGASAVMATGETAIGAHPIEVVRYFVNTVKAAENYVAGTG